MIAKSAFLPGLSLLLALMATAPSASGQSGCPFSSSDAVQDTLDPAGYYPLHTGAVWEYVVRDSGFLDRYVREEAVGDTVLGGETYTRINETNYYLHYPDTLVAFYAGPHYTRLSGTEIFGWDHFGSYQQWEKLDAPFKSCYTFDLPHSSRVTVFGGYDEKIFVEENGAYIQYRLPAIKEFGSFAGQTSYGYGIGIIGRGGDPSLEFDLVYAKVGGKAYGIPLASRFKVLTAAQRRDMPEKAVSIEVYPNPFSSVVHIRVYLIRGGLVTIQLLDALGRIVAQPVAHSYLSAGAHRFEWQGTGYAPGVYWVRVQTEGGTVATHSVLLVR